MREASTWPTDSFLSISVFFSSEDDWSPSSCCCTPVFPVCLRCSFFSPLWLFARLVPLTLLIPALSADVSALVSLSPALIFLSTTAASFPKIESEFFWSVTFISHILPHDLSLSGSLPSDPLQSQYDSWLSLVDHLSIKAFVNLTLANSVRHGMQHLLFISGLGQWCLSLSLELKCASGKILYETDEKSIVSRRCCADRKAGLKLLTPNAKC